MVANMVFNLMLAPFFGYVGLAIATTMSATLNAFMLYQGLKKGGIFSLSDEALWFMGRVILSAAVMAVVVYTISPDFSIWLEMSFSQQVFNLLTYIGLGVISYFVSIATLGIRLNDFKVAKQ